MGQGELWIVVDEIHRGDEMAGDGLGVGLVEAAEITSDLGVQVRCLDVIRQSGLVGAGGLPRLLPGAAGATAVNARPVAASGARSGSTAAPFPAGAATAALAAGAASTLRAAGATAPFPTGPTAGEGPTGAAISTPGTVAAAMIAVAARAGASAAALVCVVAVGAGGVGAVVALAASFSVGAVVAALVLWGPVAPTGYVAVAASGRAVCVL